MGKKLHTYIALDRYDVCTMSRDVGRSVILGGGESYNVWWKLWGEEAGSKDGAKMGGGGGGRVRPFYIPLPTSLMSVTGVPEFQKYC